METFKVIAEAILMYSLANILKQAANLVRAFKE
mgnify:CR=1 FL=1